LVGACIGLGIYAAYDGSWTHAITMPVYAVAFGIHYATFGVFAETDAIQADTDRILRSMKGTK